MAARLGRALALAICIACLAVARPVGATPACETAIPASNLRLQTAHPTADEEAIATREEMDAIATRVGASRAAREAHPLLLIVVQAGTHVELAHHTIEDQTDAGAAHFCDVPASVTVIIGAFKRRTILHRDAAAVPCVREALLEHQRQHVLSLDRLIDAFAEQHREALTRSVQALMRRRAPDAAAAVRAFETGLASLVGDLYGEFELAVDQSREEVDTPAALARLRQSCNGQLRQLELDLTAPPGRRASLDLHRPLGNRGAGCCQAIGFAIEVFRSPQPRFPNDRVSRPFREVAVPGRQSAQRHSCFHCLSPPSNGSVVPVVTTKL